MSIRSVGIALVALAGTGCLEASAMAQAAQAETPAEDVVGPMMEQAKEAYRLEEPPPPTPSDCVQSGDENTITVCAPIESDPDRFRVPSRLERGDDSHLGWTGQAPDVSGPGIFTGPATVGGLCFLPPCPKPPVYMIDLSALPEAPPGSDADRIARGLAPRGSRYDDGESAVESLAQSATEAEPAADGAGAGETEAAPPAERGPTREEPAISPSG